MYDFWIYDGPDRIGLLEHWTSVQWLEQYADGGEAKIVALTTPANVEMLTGDRRIYNPDTGTAARILQQTISDDGKTPTITLRCSVGAAVLSERVVMGTVNVTNAADGMQTLVSRNLRGLDIQVDSSVPALSTALGTLDDDGTLWVDPLPVLDDNGVLQLQDAILDDNGVLRLAGAKDMDTQISWGTVLDGCKTLAAASGLGFGCSFDPRTATETFSVRQGTDRTAGEAYNGYLGDDIANISDLELVRGVANHKNVAVVCGQGEGDGRVCVVVGSGDGAARRELYVDARDLDQTYQVADATGETDADGNPVYTYTTASYTAEEYQAMLAARGLEKLAEHGATLTLTATAADGSPLTYGKDYALGDVLPVKLVRYGILAAARVTGVKLIYEAGGRQVLPVLQNLQVAQAAAYNA